MSHLKIIIANSIPQGFRSHLHTPEHVSTNVANYNEHIMSLYEALHYSYSPTKKKLYYCTTWNSVLFITFGCKKHFTNISLQV